MPGNPYFLYQFLALGAACAGLGALGYHVWMGMWSSRDLVAAFRLKRLGEICRDVSAVSFLLQVLILLVGSAPITRYDLSWEALLATAACLVVGWWATSLHIETTHRSMRLAPAAAPFVRLQVCEHYLRAFPGRFGPVIPLLRDAAAMRMIAGLIHESDDQDEADKLANLLVTHLKDAPPVVIERALETGVFRHHPKRREQMQRLLKDAEMQRWEAILTQTPEAPRVGHVLARILEDALLMEASALPVEIHNHEALHSTGRQALNALLNQLQGHLQPIALTTTLPYLRSAYDAEATAPAPRASSQVKGVTALESWRLTLEPLSSSVHKAMVEVEESSFKEKRVSITQRGGSGAALRYQGPMRERVIKLVKREILYPVVRLKCTISRQGKQATEIEIDSSPGIPLLEDDHRLRRGSRPVQLAAELMLRSLVRGAGLRIMTKEEAASPSSRSQASAAEPDLSVRLPTEASAPEPALATVTATVAAAASYTTEAKG